MVFILSSVLCSYYRNGDQRRQMLDKIKTNKTTELNKLYRKNEKIKQILTQNETYKKEIKEIEEKINLNISKIKSLNDELNKIDQNDFGKRAAKQSEINIIKMKNLDLEKEKLNKDNLKNRNNPMLQDLYKEKERIEDRIEDLKNSEEILLATQVLSSTSSMEFY